MIRTGLHTTALSVLIAISSFTLAQSDYVLTKISKDKYDSLMQQDYQTFDQNFQDGWRQYYDDLQLQLELIRDYKEDDANHQRNLTWHQGQLEGMLGHNEEAAELFRQCWISDTKGDPYRVAWNYYVGGSVAFMENDESLLDLYMDSLRNYELDVNLNVLERLKRSFGKTYREAYSK